MLVWVVFLRTAAEDADGHGQLEGLGRQCRRSYLHGLEAVVGRRGREREGNQVGWESVAHGWLAEQDQLAVKQVADVRDRVLQGVHGETDVSAVEVAPMEDLARLGINQRVVAGPIDLDLKGAAEPWEGVEEDPDHVWCTANRVPILESAWLRGRILVDPLSDQPRGSPHPGMGFELERAVMKVGRIAEGDVTHHCGQRARQASQVFGAMKGQAAKRGHHGEPIHKGEALFWSQLQRGEPASLERVGGWHHLTSEEDLAFADQRRGHVGKWREIAARPDRTQAWDTGKDAVVQQGNQVLDEHRTNR